MLLLLLHSRDYVSNGIHKRRIVATPCVFVRHRVFKAQRVSSLSVFVYLRFANNKKKIAIIIVELVSEWVCVWVRTSQRMQYVPVTANAAATAAAVTIDSVYFNKPWSVKRSQRGCMLQIYRVPNFIRSNIYFILFDFFFSWLLWACCGNRIELSS